MNSKKQFSAKSVISQSDLKTTYIEIDQELRRKLQLELLSIYNDLKTVCDKYDISLFLCGGSALGAVRHHGFIPWDDDMDATMTRDDYVRFEKVFERELSDKYILKAPGYKDGSRSRFPKVIKKGTIFREIGNKSPEDECGIFFDIFILDNVPDNKVLRAFKGITCNILEFISGQVLLHEEKPDDVLNLLKKSNRKQYYIRMITGTAFSFMSSKSWNRLIDRVIQYKKSSEYCTLATGRKHYFGESLPRSVFLSGSEGEFEGQKVLLFSEPDTYLSNLYGDYMVIPEESRREQHIVEELKF